MNEYTAFYLFCGIGGMAIGGQRGRAEYKGEVARFRTLGGIDCDREACKDFTNLTGVPATCLDLFSESDYVSFHGHQPPPDWREVSGNDILAATGWEYPDMVALSPPCKGFSGLLPSKTAASEKYQALNRLTVRGLSLTLEAFKEDLPTIIMIENVPRITSRGVGLLGQVKALLSKHGYLFTEDYHDCGQLGGLAQHRKRYLLIARLPEKMSSFVYWPPRKRVRAIGEAICPLPLPDDPAAGPMHRLPRLTWKTWVRLALILAGGDWRDLENCGQYALEHVPRSGVFQVAPWDEPAKTVVGHARPGGSNGVAAIVDPRTGFKDSTHHAIYRVMPWDETANTITGAMRPNNGAISVADPHLNCNPRNGTMGVQDWNQPAKTVIGAGDIHAGAAAVADPRIPADQEVLDPPPVIIALDGTWHRPLTTMELAVLQGFDSIMPDGNPLKLSGKSDKRWRERIGNAVPPPAFEAIAEEILFAFLVNKKDEWILSNADIWVKPVNSNCLVYTRNFYLS